MEHVTKFTEINSTYLFLIPFLPLFGAFINGTIGSKLQSKFGKWIIHTIALTPVGISFLLSVTAFITLFTSSHEAILTQNLWTWFGFNWHGLSLTVDFSLAIDHLGSVMTLVVTGVGFIIHVFSTGYMQDEKPYWRFFAEMNLFMFAMLVLVMGDNFILMFLGWEGVGLCSYLLISYYYNEVEKAAAGMKAFVVNRIGDFAFIVGMMMLVWAFVGTWVDGAYLWEGKIPTVSFRHIQALMQDDAFRNVFLAKEIWGIPVVTISCILFFIGACGKSAQIPLYVWLPDAMAGPTPVSALIHAATMVTAGVYLIARLNFLFVHSPLAMTVVTVVGAITALFAATIGFFQTDIKKVLAYSTVSQLGYMFVGVGVGAFHAGIFHLSTHAYFKACLFLGTGSIIYGLHHKQDMKDMGGLKKLMPATFLTFIVATAAIAGIPGLSGFFSKDEILWKAFDSGNILISGEIIWFIMAVAAMFTAFYMTRLVIQVFFGDCRLDEHTKLHVKEYKRMTYPLYILAMLAVVGGFVGIPSALGGGNHFEKWLEPVFAYSLTHLKWVSETHTTHAFSLHSHSGEYILMFIAVMLALLGIYIAYRIYGKKYLSPEDEADKFGVKAHRLIFNKYFMDEIYQYVIINNFMRLCRVLSWFDKWIIDGLVNLCGLLVRVFGYISGALDKYIVDGAVNTLANGTLSAGKHVRRMQTGQIENYILGIVTGICCLVVLIFLII